MSQLAASFATVTVLHFTLTHAHKRDDAVTEFGSFYWHMLLFGKKVVIPVRFGRPVVAVAVAHGGRARVLRGALLGPRAPRHRLPHRLRHLSLRKFSYFSLTKQIFVR